QGATISSGSSLSHCNLTWKSLPQLISRVYAARQRTDEFCRRLEKRRKCRPVRLGTGRGGEDAGPDARRGVAATMVVQEQTSGIVCVHHTSPSTEGLFLCRDAPRM